MARWHPSEILEREWQRKPPHRVYARWAHATATQLPTKVTRAIREQIHAPGRRLGAARSGG
eukprot:10085322-Alexandrium_andersonii.AAC.1